MSIRTKKCTRTGIRRPRIRQAKYKGLSIIVPQTRGHNSDSEQIISDPIPEITAPWLRPTIRKNTHHIVAEQRMKQLELDDLIEFRGN